MLDPPRLSSQRVPQNKERERETLRSAALLDLARSAALSPAGGRASGEAAAARSISSRSASPPPLPHRLLAPVLMVALCSPAGLSAPRRHVASGEAAAPLHRRPGTALLPECSRSLALCRPGGLFGRRRVVRLGSPCLRSSYRISSSPPQPPRLVGVIALRYEIAPSALCLWLLPVYCFFGTNFLLRLPRL